MTTGLGRKLVVLAVSASVLTDVETVTAQIEEVVVTARKKDEMDIEVPVSLTNVASDQIDQYALNSLSRVADQVPSLLVGEGSMAMGSQLSLRGVGTSVLTPTIDQSISLNVDGLQLTQGLAYQMAMFDMSHIQVLKGPQGLFFGKASPGGVIAINTADPTDEFELILKAGYESEAEEQQTQVILSGALTDTLGMRLATKFSDSEGFFKNKAIATPGTGAITPDDDSTPETDTTLARATVVWEPTDTLQSRFKLNYAKTETEGITGTDQIASCPDGIAPSISLLPPFLGGDDCKLDGTKRVVYIDPAAFPGVANNGVPFTDTEQWFGSVELIYSLSDEWTLTSVTGWYELEQSTLINGTMTSSAGPILLTASEFERDDFTQEVRINSDFYDSSVNYMLGAFYQDGSMYFNALVPGNTAYLFPSVLQTGYHDVDIEAKSLFGQITWAITDELELAVGARWTDEQRKLIQTDLIGTLFGGDPVTTPLAGDELDTDNLSPELTITYTPSYDLTVYGSLKKAFKSGSFDTSGLLAPGDTASFGDEKVEGAELGLKSRLFDNTVAFNIGAYYYQFEDMQVGANDLSSAGNLVVKTTNAGSSQIEGLDIDLTYAPPQFSGLTINSSINWNKAEYDEFDNAQCRGGQTISEGCNRDYSDNANGGLGGFVSQDLSGRELMRAPEWSVVLGVNYEKPLENGMTLSMGATTRYSDEYYTNLLLHKDSIQDSYFKTSANITLKGRDDAWELSLTGNNLENEITTGNCVNQNFTDGVVFGQVLGTMITGADFRGPAGVDELLCSADTGRSLWINLTLRPFNFNH